LTIAACFQPSQARAQDHNHSPADVASGMTATMIILAMTLCLIVTKLVIGHFADGASISNSPFHSRSRDLLTSEQKKSRLRPQNEYDRNIE
jgi:hypothetical protein